MFELGPDKGGHNDFADIEQIERPGPSARFGPSAPLPSGVKRPCHTFDSPFGFGDRVLIDGDASITGTVTACCFREERPEIEVAWFNNGAHYTAWFSPRRLSDA